MIINFSNLNNISLQIGDTAYYAIPNDIGVTGDPVQIGMITSISNNSIEIANSNIEVPQNAFIMFSKNNTVNNGSLKGYYAEVTMRNDITEEAELFAVGSEVSPSSK